MTMTSDRRELDRVTDPANRQYTAFTAENATYYIPRQPSGAYPRWFGAVWNDEPCTARGHAALS